MNIKLNDAALGLREELGLSTREAARETGIDYVTINRIERGWKSPSPAVIEKYRKAWGVDLYVFAWCRYGDVSELPGGVRKATRALIKCWEPELHKAIQKALGKSIKFQKAKARG